MICGLEANLKTQIDSKNQTTTFEYDELNRIKQKHYADCATCTDVIYSYDKYDDGTSVNAVGRLTKVSDESGTTTFYYDKLGNVTRTVTNIDGIDYPVRAEYDDLERIKSIVYPDNVIIKYKYDDGGNLWKVTDGSETMEYAVYTDYNALGQAGTVDYNNGVNTKYQYDILNNNLFSITTNSPTEGLQNISYAYDNAGNITAITNYMSEPPVTPLSPAVETYVYNTTKSADGKYTIRPHAVTDIGPASYHYDDNGNMKDGGGRTMDYNYDNMPKSMTYKGNATSFVYDYSGQRVKKNSTVYIGGLYECTGDTCAKHIYAGDERLASIKTSGPATVTYYYHTDHLGSSRVITKDDATKVQKNDYYSFGEARYSNGSVVPYKYTGQEGDPETDLYYYGARYYDPALGNFISADSLVSDYTDSQSFNRYSYVLNNPMIYIDPTGHEGLGLSAGYVGYSGFDFWSSYSSFGASSGSYTGGSSSDSYWNYIGGGTASNSAANQSAQNTVIELTRLLYAEGVGEYRINNAMEGLGSVVRSRVEAKGFPDTYYGVIHQKNQFSSVRPYCRNECFQWDASGNPQNLSGTSLASYKRAFTVAEGIYNGSIDDPTGGALFFHSGTLESLPKKNANFFRTVAFTKKIGGTSFYKPRRK